MQDQFLRERYLMGEDRLSSVEKFSEKGDDLNKEKSG